MYVRRTNNLDVILTYFRTFWEEKSADQWPSASRNKSDSVVKRMYRIFQQHDKNAIVGTSPISKKAGENLTSYYFF